MKKIIFSVIMLVSVIMCFTGCTEHDVVVDLPEGQKLEEVTWKDTELWYLTRLMREDEFPETHVFQEKSSWGIWEGTVTIIEH